jgi:hypothetical protein
MAAAVTPVATRHRPPSVVTTVGVLLFLGLSAIAGGVALTLDGGAAPSRDWLDEIPLIDSWRVPGLVLGIGFGLGSLVAGYGMWRRPRWPWLRPVERLTRHHWSWPGTILIGAGQIAWISLELVYLPELSILQAVYGAVGLALVLLPLLPSARNHLHNAPEEC